MTKSKILALLFTTFVIALMLMSGPVEGFNLNLSVSDETPRQGELVTFVAEINVEQTERLPVDKIVLELSGRENIACSFDKNGQPLDGCENIRVTKIQGPTFGYGYGYSSGYGYGFAPGLLKYKIEIDTKKIKSGTYTSLIKVKIGDQFYTQAGKTITIRSNGNEKNNNCPQEWTCSPWSSCSAGLQYRECYRNLNACEINEMPQQERLCLLEDSTNFPEEETSNLSSLGSTTLESENRPAIQFLTPEFSNGLRFIVILLLMNCIITLTNIIVKVQENKSFQTRKFKKLPSVPPTQKTK